MLTKRVKQAGRLALETRASWVGVRRSSAGLARRGAAEGRDEVEFGGLCVPGVRDLVGVTRYLQRPWRSASLQQQAKGGGGDVDSWEWRGVSWSPPGQKTLLVWEGT